MSKTTDKNEKSHLTLILCKHEAKRHREDQMASLAGGMESKAKLLGPIHPPDEVCVSRPVSGVSGSGCSEDAVTVW